MATTTTVGTNGEGEQKRREKGGFKTMPFILGNDICDRFATAGFGVNLITYLTKQMHLPLVDATNLLNNFGGTASLTTILGALAADSFAGRFWTIVAGSVFYQLAMVGLVVSAILPPLRPSPCSAPPSGPGCQRPSGLHLTVLYLSLLCMCFGTGGLRPCVVMFGTDQFDHELGTTKQVTAEAAGVAAEKKRRYFNLYFFTMGIAALLAITVVVYIQDNVGWGLGFGIPAMAMFVSIMVFAIGYPLYVRLKPGGSPFTRLAQVAVAAYKKRNVVVPEDTDKLYQDKELDVLISTTGRLLHTNQLTFLDRAAIVMPGDISASGQPNLWRLSTVHRVEELKSIIRMLPIWSAGILLSTIESNNGSFLIFQAQTMDRHITRHFEIPPATMSIFGIGAYLVSLALYDRAFVPLARRVTGRQSGITYFQRMGFGLAIHIVAVATSALVETKRRHTAADNGFLDNPTGVIPLSVFWLVPQFAINGLAGAFSGPGHMEFLYDQSPESMRSTAASLFWLSGSFGSYLGTILVTVVQRTTRAHGNDWLQDNINRGRIDNFYWLITCLLVLNLGYFLICFRFYTMKPLEMANEQDGHDGEYELSTLEKNDTTGARGVV